MTNNKKNNGGRPAGRRKTAKIEISIEPSVKEEFMNLMRVQGKTASVEIGLWIREYLKDIDVIINVGDGDTAQIGRAHV